MHQTEQLRTLYRLCGMMLEQAQQPATQLSGYLQTGDPTYLPPGPVRRMAGQMEPEVLLETLVSLFLTQGFHPAAADPA